jgi:hypothetical protein
MNRPSTFKLLFGLGLYFFLSLSLTAQNQKISIQGTLKDASGASVPDGEVEVTFKLYHETGDALWEETATVPVIGGIYSHNLGSENPLSPASIFSQPLFLGVTVGGRELNPRTELTYAPYAISVASTQQIAQGGCSGQVGDIKYSILAPDDFARENGDCWVPMDGRNVSGSKLASYGWNNVPDMSGNFIRAAGGRAGSVGTIQEDEIKSHHHTYDEWYLTQVRVEREFSGGVGDIRSPSSGTTITTFATGLFSDGIYSGADQGTDFRLKFKLKNRTGISTSNTGGDETRPRNMSFYIYIRIN